MSRLKSDDSLKLGSQPMSRIYRDEATSPASLLYGTTTGLVVRPSAEKTCMARARLLQSMFCKGAAASWQMNDTKTQAL